MGEIESLLLESDAGIADFSVYQADTFDAANDFDGFRRLVTRTPELFFTNWSELCVGASPSELMEKTFDNTYGMLFSRVLTCGARPLATYMTSVSHTSDGAPITPSKRAAQYKLKRPVATGTTSPDKG